MSFAAPGYLIALLVVPLALGAYAVVQRRRRRYAVRFPGVSTLAAVLTPAGRWRRHVPPVLFALALSALALALARPEATRAVAVERASVMLVTDVSGSMRATDVEPSRLAAAQRAARTFLSRVPDELRVGALSFSSAPVASQPPSQEREGVRTLIDSLVADGGTATGEGLSDALDLLEDDDDRRRPPAAIVLLSDGKTTLGRDPVEVAREAGRRKVPIYTVSLGTDAGTVQAGPLGQTLAVPPDPETLRRIARESGGRDFTVEDSEELGTIYERLGSQIGTRQEKREITPWFAAAGMVLLAGSALSSLRRFGRLP